MQGKSGKTRSRTDQLTDGLCRRVLIADSDRIFLDGLRLALEAEFDIRAEATNSLGCLAKIRDVDIAILGFLLSCGRNALGLLPDIKLQNASVKVIILVSPAAIGIIPRLHAAGAHGVISRRVDPFELPRLIHAAFVGETLPAISRVGLQNDSTPSCFDLSVLTSRELEVFRLIGLGKSTKEIGSLLGTSEKTASSHRENIKAKLNLQSAHALNLAAISHTLCQITGMGAFV